MNRSFAKKTLLFKEQDSADVVLLLFMLFFPATALLPHAHAVAALCSLCAFLYAISKKYQTYGLQKTGICEYVFLLFLVFTATGAVLHGASAHVLLSLTLRLGFFVPFFRSDKKDAVCRAYAVSGALYGALAIAERLLGLAREGWADETRFSALARVSGPFGNPNLFAAFLLPALLFAVREGLLLRRYRFFLAALLSGAGLLLTFSRGAWCAAAVGIFLLAAHRFGILSALLTPIAALPLASLLLPHSLLSRLSSLTSPDSSVLYRFSIWKSVLRAPREALLLGVGEGKAAMLELLLPVMSAGLLKVEHTHSLLLHLLVADGVIGLCLFLVFAAVCLWRGKKSGAAIPFLSLLLFGLFDDPLYGGQTEVLFWFCAGLC